MLRRTCFVLLLGLILAISVARSSTSTALPSAGGADVTGVAGGFDKLEGTATGTYHAVDGYHEDSTITADIKWVEDPGYVQGCACRAFFPEGDINWTWSVGWGTDYSDPACEETQSGHLLAGAGLAHVSQQMLLLWDDPNNPDQYFYSVSGYVPASWFSNCYNNTQTTGLYFLDIKAPTIDYPTPTIPFPLAAPAASAPLCENAKFTVARDAKGFAGSCYQSLDANGYHKYEWDFGLTPEPIVFIHGFLGSKINCGGTELWPNIGVFARPELLQMSLAADGISPAPGACAATVGDILGAVPGKKIYSPAVDFLNQLEPGNVFYFNWDWRSGPQQSLARLDSFIEGIRAAHDDSKVVIMAHSYGGLLARLYVDDGGRADKVARVLTVGTPAWGAPKALFPLYAGVEEPGAGFLSLGLFLDKDDLHEFAKNLLGEYFLYPSQSYGSWLIADPSSNTPVSRQGLLDYVTLLGGNAALLDQALNLHAGTLDSAFFDPPPSGVRFNVIVGTGLPTITGVRVLPGGRLSIEYGNGDGTVPARSAARGALGSSNQNHSQTYYSCNVGHVDLPGHHQITDAIDDFLKFGDDIKGLTHSCDYHGVQFRLFRLPQLPSSVSGSGLELTPTPGPPGALSIGDAVLQGNVDYLDLPNEKFVITGTEFPEVALPQGKFLEMTPLSNDTKGQPVLYGPLAGQITISGGVDGPVVLVNGDRAPLDGDVNCDEEVTILDALLLLLAAGGTPKSQPDGCAAIGAGADPFGDVDCDHSVTAMDALADLRIVAGVPLAFLAGCQ